MSRPRRSGPAGPLSLIRRLRAAGLAPLVVLVACSQPTGVDAPDGAEGVVRQIVGWRADGANDSVVLYLDRWPEGDPGIAAGGPPYVVAEPASFYQLDGDRLERANVRDVRWGERVEIWRPDGGTEITQVWLLLR